MTTVRFLGHAGLRIDGGGARVLLDPWFARTGAFLGSWHQFPRNDHLDCPELLDVDYVAVSHEHLDHMDLGLLRRLPTHVRVLIPAYPSPVFRTRLAAAGIGNVIEIAAWQRFPLDTSGGWIAAVPEQSPMCHDAAFLVSLGGQSVLHTNDARLTAAQVRRAGVEVGGQLDLMCLQMSGASWHPICYEYPDEVRRGIEADKRLGKFRAVLRVVRAATPRLAVPFAGPPCFLDPTLRGHNISMRPPGIFPDQRQAAEWLGEHLPRQAVASLRPGDRVDLASLAVTPDGVSAGVPTDDDAVADYLERYAKDRAPALESVYTRYPVPDSDFGELFADRMCRLGELNRYVLERIDLTMRFDVAGPGGGRWDVTFGPDRVRVDLHGRAREVNYRLRLAGRWLLPVLNGRIGWEDLLLSLRFSAWREPDIYNDYLVGLLKHANGPALAAVEHYESRRDPAERIIVRAEGADYEIGRYCPHAGEDLAESAVVQGGRLRCLAHNFEFDLATGACLNARCAPLATTELAPLSG